MRFTRDPASPYLVPLDKGFQVIPFQFPPESLQVNGVGSGYAESSSLNREHPILQFTKGLSQTVTFEARLFAETILDDLQPLLTQLQTATQRDPKLKRPPIWIFVFGDALDIKCVVAELGPIKYGSLRGGITNGLTAVPIVGNAAALAAQNAGLGGVGGAGTPRDVTLSITLKRYEPFDVAVTDPDARPHDTFYRVVRTNDLWETLAARQYDDPNKGEFLRRLNPSMPSPEIGETILMPDVEKLDDVPISPDSIPLARTASGIALAREMFAARGGVLHSSILKK